MCSETVAALQTGVKAALAWDQWCSRETRRLISGTGWWSLKLEKPCCIEPEYKRVDMLVCKAYDTLGQQISGAPNTDETSLADSGAIVGAW